MKNIKLKYKGFVGTAQWSKYDNLYYGRILNTTDLVSYDGQTLKELNKDFILAVEDYIEICAEYNKLFTKKMFLESRIHIFTAMVKKYSKKVKDSQKIKIFKVDEKWGYATYNKKTKTWQGKYQQENKKVNFKTFNALKEEIRNSRIKKKYITLPRRNNNG